MLSYVKWDKTDPHNVVAGANHRMGVDTQQMMQQVNPHYGLENNPRMQQHMMFAADCLAKFLQERCLRFHSTPVPLDYSGALLVIEALKKTQPKAKIMKLRAVAKQIPWESLQRFGLKAVPHSGTQLFIKDEGYPAGDKPPRLISFPQEGEKLLMSMAFYHIMHPMFSSAYCTKEVPEHLRPKTIENRLGELPNKFVADYTSFECVPNKLMMQLGEHRVLRQLVPREYHFLFDKIEAGGVLTHRSGVTMKTPAVQYSGRYTTSLCNTIRNKLLMDCVALELGVGLSGYRGVYEGDDSLTAWPRHITKEQVTDALGKLGVAAEIDQVERVGSAGYCSMYWNENYELICDPIKVLATFPFSTSQLASSPANAADLLSAKAMSLAYRAPGCPIVSAVVRRYIKSTGTMETRNEYERRWFREFSHLQRNQTKSNKRFKVVFDRWDLVREPTQQQRLLFWDIFGVSPQDQVTCENKILTEEGFTMTMFMCLSDAQPKCGVLLERLMEIYWTMSERAKSTRYNKARNM